MIELDCTNVFEEAVGDSGIPSKTIEQAIDSSTKLIGQLENIRVAGNLGFADLPFSHDSVRSVETFARQRGSSHVLVVGIGGSALGPIAIDSALNSTGSGRRLWVLDNVDPDFIHDTLEQIDPHDVIVNVIAKSGVTAETMATFAIVRRWLIDAIGETEARSQFVVTTDPVRGDLLAIARQEGYPTFTIPENVGGRFSVLSPVGILPAALLGFNVEKLMEGARRGAVKARSPFWENPALTMAFIQWFLDQHRQKTILTLFPYSRSLWQFSFWYKQLWGESLGKKLDRQGREIFCGQTPTAVLGVTDQHSQLQLFIEGPNDKSFVFWRAKNFRNSLSIDDAFPECPSMTYFKGRDIAQLLAAEREATEIALTEVGRPNITISVDMVDEESFGELIMFCQYATAYAGEFYDVNAFDQPGVDYGKRLTFAMMERDGFAEYAPRVEAHRSRTRVVVR